MSLTASRALRIAAKRFRKLLGRPEDPEVVRLRACAPTVSKHETAKLGKRFIQEQPDYGEKLPVDFDNLPS